MDSFLHLSLSVRGSNLIFYISWNNSIAVMIYSQLFTVEMMSGICFKIMSVFKCVGGIDETRLALTR